MTWLIVGGGVALIAFALFAMMGGGGSTPADSDSRDRDNANAVDLSLSD